MIAHPDAEASRYPPEENRNEDSFPRKEEQRRNSANVKGGHKKCGHPVVWSSAGRFLSSARSCVIFDPPVAYLMWTIPRWLSKKGPRAL
jgi:hypothetical protein